MSQKKFNTVAELLAEEGRWCKRFYALDENSRSINPLDSDACRWCLYGACMKVYGEGKPADDAIGKVWHVVDRGPIMFNDSSTHAEVLAAVKAAGI